MNLKRWTFWWRMRPHRQHLRRTLEAGGIEFIDENGGGLGVRLRKRQRLKKPK